MMASIEIELRRLRRVGTLVELLAGMPKKEPRYALFLGAGASISSGVPGVATLVKNWTRRVFLDDSGIAKWHPNLTAKFDVWEKSKTGYTEWRRSWERDQPRHPSDYSLFFSYAYPDVDARQGYIERLVEGCEPGPGYVYLSTLVLSNVFHIFLTTNFDDLINDALLRYAGLRPIVCAFDSQVSSVRLQSARPKILKLHGDFLFSNLRNVGAEVSRLDINMEEKFSRTCESYGLIVMGYGAGDLSVMAPLRAMLHQPDKLRHGLHWCLYVDELEKKKPSDKISIPEELFRMWDSYPDNVHLYAVGKFDDVMCDISVGCGCKPPPELAEPEDKILYYRLLYGLENADQSWRLSKAFDTLMKTFHQATSNPPPKSRTQLIEADRINRSAALAIKNGSLPNAIGLFEEARQLVDEVLGTHPLPSIAYRIWAHRRRGGAGTSIAECLWSRQTKMKVKQDSPKVRKMFINSRASAKFLQLANESYHDACDGLDLCQDVDFPADLRGHIRNLYFIGCTALGFVLYLKGKLEPEMRNHACQWLERLAADEAYGIEYVEDFLPGELGGKLLIDYCAPQR